MIASSLCFRIAKGALVSPKAYFRMVPYVEGTRWKACRRKKGGAKLRHWNCICEEGSNSFAQSLYLQRWKYVSAQTEPGVERQGRALQEDLN